jgi:dethiobiotin synthetase
VRGLFVTGTDTGVGKTVLSAALLAAMAAEGEQVCAYKPVLTGLDEHSASPAGAWPPDHELLALAAGTAPGEVAPLRYRPAASPHLAAELAGERIDPGRLIASLPITTAASASTVRAEAAQTGDPVGAAGCEERTIVVEGVGGLLVPIDSDYTVRELAMELGLPLLIAARPTLGTINHTLLTLHAARAAGLLVVAVVLTPWPARPSRLERSNRESIARLGAVEVEGLARVRRADSRELARAGATLPWRRWLAQPSAREPARAASTSAAVNAVRSASSMTYGGIV